MFLKGLSFSAHATPRSQHNLLPMITANLLSVDTIASTMHGFLDYRTANFSTGWAFLIAQSVSHGHNPIS